MNIPIAVRKANYGFTLVEMLTVITIAGILAVITVPAVQGLGRAGGFNQSVYSLSDSLNLARSYAMANNTYVYVGLTEVDRSQSSLASPQAPGAGRVVLSMVATKDGTSDATASAWSATGSHLTQVRQIQSFDFFHIASTSTSTPFLSGTGTMARPSNIASTSVTLLPMPAAAAPAATQAFSLPLGSTSGSGKYNFSNTNTQILCFNPQGGVLLNGTAVQWLEIDVQPMNGSSTPAAPTNVNKGDQAALVLDGVTGSVTVYRP